MLTIYKAESKHGKATITISYSPALRLFKIDLNGLQSIETRHTLPTTLDRLKPRLRSYNLIHDEVQSYL